MTMVSSALLVANSLLSGDFMGRAQSCGCFFELNRCIVQLIVNQHPASGF